MIVSCSICAGPSRGIEMECGFVIGFCDTCFLTLPFRGLLRVMEDLHGIAEADGRCDCRVMSDGGGEIC